MTSKYEGHTPEPWGRDGQTVYALTLNMQGMPVNRFSAHVQHDSVPVSNGELEANAELMTDAPDLLKQRDALREALKAARKYIDDIDGMEDDGRLRHECEFDTNPEKGACDTCNMWADVEAALALCDETEAE